MFFKTFFVLFLSNTLKESIDNILFETWWDPLQYFLPTTKTRHSTIAQLINNHTQLISTKLKPDFAQEEVEECEKRIPKVP